MQLMEMMNSLYELNLKVGWVSMVACLVGYTLVMMNYRSMKKMIEEGYAWAYDGGTKQKNFEELREIRRSFGTLDAG